MPVRENIDHVVPVDGTNELSQLRSWPTLSGYDNSLLNKHVCDYVIEGIKFTVHIIII